jgi:ABC-type glycerol-3-phosphate transport system substrate-binding protein
MKKTLLLLSCAVGLTLASCSQNKTEDTAATTAADGTTTTTTTTTTTSYSEDAIQRRADRIAADMAAKMKLDEAARTKVRTIYVTRGQRIGELQQKYASDTTGMAAAMRDVYTNTDTELKSVFTDPTQYSAYQSSRMEYMDDRYMDDDAMSSSNMDSSSMDNSSMSSGSTSGSMQSGSDMQTGADGKVKVKRDGDVKLKDSEGNKAKIDADDATMKVKPNDGGKTVIK